MKTTINIKTDTRTKKSAQKTAEALGLSLHEVMNAYLKEFISGDEIMNHKTEKLIEQIEQDIKNNKNISKPITTQRELKQYLSSL